MTPHKGHLALQLAAGEVDGVIGSGALRHVVRGSAQKYQQREERESAPDAKGETHARVFMVDHFKVQVLALGPDGEMHTL